MSAIQEHRPRLKADTAVQYGELLNHGIVITRGCCWVDGSNYIFRSTEFDVFSEGDDFESALRQFGSDMEGRLLFLFELVRKGDATDHEFAEFEMLGERFIQATMAHEDEREPRVTLNLRRRSRQRKVWRYLPSNSSALSHA